MRSLHELPGLTDTGKLLFRRATLKIYDRPTLRAVVQGIHEMDLAPHEGHDIKGDMYEYLLSKLSQSGTNGQFRTPRHIIDLIVALVDPQPGQRICDPACGTAGFLISAYTHILRTAHQARRLGARASWTAACSKPKQWKFLEEQAFTGFDNDANMVKIAILNLYLHQLERARIEHFNPLTTGFGGPYPGQLFDVILANPPFAGKVQEESILADLNYKLNTRATELLFLKWFIDHLAPRRTGGRHRAQRRAFRLQQRRHKVARTAADRVRPAGRHQPAQRRVQALRRRWHRRAHLREGASRPKVVWFYDLTADGFSLDDKRTPIEANDIPDVLAKWPGREEGPNSYRVPIEKIRENDWSLAAGRYKPVTTEAVNHDAPAEILGDVLKLENEIIRRGKGVARHNQRGEMKAWPTKPLGELCSVVAGGTPSRTRAEYYDGGIPWVKIGDMLQGTVVRTEESISRLGLESSAAKLLPPGTVLISIFATIGRTAVLGIEASTNQAIAGVTPRDVRELSPPFLRYFLDRSVASLVGEARGVAQLNINGKILKSLPIPLPPIAEQERLVKLLDEANALRLVRAEADKRAEALIPALFDEMFGDAKRNPHGFRCEPLGNLLRVKSGRGLPAKEMGAGGMFPVYGGNGISGYHTEFMLRQAHGGHRARWCLLRSSTSHPIEGVGYR